MIYLDNDSEYCIIPNLMGLDVRRVRGIVKNNVTNEEVIGYGTNSSDNPLYLKFNFAEGWLNQFPSNEYSVKILAYNDVEEDWIFIGEYLFQKGIQTSKDASVYNDEINYIQFD